MQHLTFLRMQRAAELLFSTDEKVARIAEQVGYSDPFAFSVAFKKWTGCPPSEFRELRRQNVK
jgi:AraC-like DNA-binding protein